MAQDGRQVPDPVQITEHIHHEVHRLKALFDTKSAFVEALEATQLLDMKDWLIEISNLAVDLADVCDSKAYDELLDTKELS